jgi:hypothetical protein
MVWQGPSCFSHSSVPLGALSRVVHSNRKVESREIQQLCLVTTPVMSFERQTVHSVGWRSNQYFATSDCQYPNWFPHWTWPRWFRGLWGKPNLFCTLCLFQRCVCHGANVRHWGPWLLWGPRSNFCGHPVKGRNMKEPLNHRDLAVWGTELYSPCFDHLIGVPWSTPDLQGIALGELLQDLGCLQGNLRSKKQPPYESQMI